MSIGFECIHGFSEQEDFLFLDNAPVHIVDEETSLRLTYVKVQFFPSNFTSLLQPLDAGIIRSMKALSRKQQVLQLLKFI